MTSGGAATSEPAQPALGTRPRSGRTGRRALRRGRPGADPRRAGAAWLIGWEMWGTTWVSERKQAAAV
ncbi:MAG: hypothetical protein R2734_13840 [Nocardioides sp.]